MRIRLFVILLLSGICSLANAQSASDGNDFYLGLLYPSYNTVSAQAAKYSVVALVSSLEDNTISVSYFDPVTGIEEVPITYTVTALNSITIPLNIPKMKMTTSEVSAYRSVHIKGKKRISVQYYSSGPSSGGAYLGLPTNVLGRKYVVSSYNDNPDGVGALIGGEAPSGYDVACGEFVIIGTQNGTNVTITMRSESEGGIKAGDSKTVTLNRGECYLVRSKCISNDADISGSIVESNHPVSVISGHSNAALGSVGDKIVELRDFMIEQMIPVEYWDTRWYSGYTGVPFISATPYTVEGAGDSYKVFAYDPSGVLVKMNGNIDITPTRLDPKEKFDVEGAVTFSSTTKKPFSVVQYDQASQSDNPLAPRPSMMQLVPTNRYRAGYHFSVPKNSTSLTETQNDYICIVPPPPDDMLWVAKNGAKAVPLTQAGLSAAGTFTNGGKIYKVSPGSYRIFSPNSNYKFMIYQYGYRLLSQDALIHDYDGDDNYTSYAMPAGIAFPLTDTTNISVTVEEICGGWNICATDNRIEGGIASAFLADDPYGDIFPFDPRKRGPYQYNNTSFEKSIDPNQTREVIFSGKPEQICFKVFVDNTTKNAYAPLYITDIRGNGKMIDLYHAKRILAFKPDVPEDGYYPSYYGTHMIKQATDSVISVINLSGADQYIPISSVHMKYAKEIKIVSTSPTIPAVLPPGDTMRITVRFIPPDTGYFSDTLSIVSDCLTKKYILDGNGAVGLIAASDHNFGKLTLHKETCWDTITVRNTGRMPFTLKESYHLTDKINFFFDSTSVRVGNRNVQLPVVIPEGEHVKLHICYHPTTLGDHNAELILQTDIPSPYTTKQKNIIKLKGAGISSTKVVEELQLEELRIHPNPTLGEDITTSFGLTEPKELRFAVYDMLGREVLSVPSSYYAKGKQSVTLPVSKLSEGGYILRVSDGELTKSISFRVIK